MSWKDVAEKFGEIDVFTSPDKPIAPGAESWNQMRDRVIRFLSFVARRHAGETVLIFTHKGVVDATIEAWLNVSPRALGIGTSNTGVTTWLMQTNEHGGFAPVLISYNDFSHLEL